MSHVRLPRRLTAATALILLAACGSDSTAPAPFPAVSGAFHIEILIDGLSANLASGSGVITFTQASRHDGALGATAQVVMDFATGDAVTISGITAAAVTESGEVSFRLLPPNASSTWRFTGQLSPSGALISGTHTLVGTSSTSTGTWTATRQ